MEASRQQTVNFGASLQLLLFVDKRPVSNERIRQIRQCLRKLSQESPYPYELQVIDVSEQPYLAEFFKLVATPSLIKVHPEPRQTLAGTNLVAQLENWWPRWQRALEDYENLDPSIDQPAESSLNGGETNGSETNGSETNGTTVKDGHPKNQQIQSVVQSAEVMRLSDEIFRLSKEKEELQAQLQFQDQLIAILAHDLRNPLTTLSIALETLEMGITREVQHPRMTPELLTQMIRQARTQARALDRMITDILQVAREQNAEFRIQPQELDLGALCLEVIARLENHLQVKGHHMHTDIPSDLPHVYADAERVRQVLMNLLDNAIKYTPNSGQLSLAILHRTTQKVQVSICDNGPGIPTENQEHIFDNRFRLQRDQETEGYGIGLSVCKRIVQAHYGQIWVDSAPNQGSCFHFTLPVYRLLKPAKRG